MLLTVRVRIEILKPLEFQIWNLTLSNLPTSTQFQISEVYENLKQTNLKSLAKEMFFLRKQTLRSKI